MISVDSTTGSIKIKDKSNNNFIEPLEIENNNVKLNYGYGLGIKNAGYEVERKKNLDVILYSDGGLKFVPAADSNFGISLDIDNPFKLEKGKLKSEYDNGLRLSKDLNSKLELYIDPHAGIEYWGSIEGQKYLGLLKNIANFVRLVKNSGLKLENNKLTIDIDKLKELLYSILGSNLIYNSVTK